VTSAPSTTIDRTDIAGVILAGGLARRMGGGDKALKPLAGRSLLARVIERFAPQVGPLALSANGDPARFSAFGLDVIADPLPGALGPIAGIAAAWIWAGARRPPCRHVATIAVDTPFLPLDLISRLAGALAAAPDAGVAVAASAGRVHPVAALHRIGEVEPILAGLADGSLRRVMRWLDDRRPVIVDFPFDPTDPFENLNTEADLAAVAERLPRAD
jgi:molybdopterin-guanine dinucleotide biosynthesis protein A